jgi:lipopolysaccharide biosynthesis regulator YciM
MNLLRLAESFTGDEAIARMRRDGNNTDRLRDHQEVEICLGLGNVFRSRGDGDPAILRK